MIYQILFFPCLIGLIVLFVLWWITGHRRDYFKAVVAKLEDDIKRLIATNRTLLEAIVEAEKGVSSKSIILGKIKEKVEKIENKTLPDNPNDLVDYINRLH